jgi:hypothetical protein
MGVGVARLGVSLRPDTDTNLTGAPCVYQKPKNGRSGGEAHQGCYVNL